MVPAQLIGREQQREDAQGERQASTPVADAKQTVTGGQLQYMSGAFSM